MSRSTFLAAVTFVVAAMLLSAEHVLGFGEPYHRPPTPAQLLRTLVGATVAAGGVLALAVAFGRVVAVVRPRLVARGWTLDALVATPPRAARTLGATLLVASAALAMGTLAAGEAASVPTGLLVRGGALLLGVAAFVVLAGTLAARATTPPSTLPTWLPLTALLAAVVAGVVVVSS